MLLYSSSVGERPYATNAFYIKQITPFHRFPSLSHIRRLIRISLCRNWDHHPLVPPGSRLCAAFAPGVLVLDALLVLGVAFRLALRGAHVLDATGAAALVQELATRCVKVACLSLWWFAMGLMAGVEGCAGRVGVAGGSLREAGGLAVGSGLSR